MEVNQTSVWETRLYYIKLPLAQALEVRDQIEETIWSIARTEDVEQTLQDAQFEVQAGKPALDPGTWMIIIIGWVAMKTVDKVTDKALDKAIDKTYEAWITKILPRLKQTFGDEVLVENEEDEDEVD